jgi:hypothetical protein
MLRVVVKLLERPAMTVPVVGDPWVRSEPAEDGVEEANPAKTRTTTTSHEEALAGRFLNLMCET